MVCSLRELLSRPADSRRPLHPDRRSHQQNRMEFTPLPLSDFMLLFRPTAIVAVTAHWEERVTTVSTHEAPPMLYDYYGFPPGAGRARE